MDWIVWLWIGLFVVCGMLFIFRRQIRWGYESFLVWRAIIRAQNELRKIGKGEIADAIKWDEKWFGRKDN